MSSPSWMALRWRFFFVCGAVVLAVGAASAQSSPSPSQDRADLLQPGESSSSQFQVVADDGAGGADELHPAVAAPGSGGGAAAGQYQEHGWKSNLSSNFALEAGGGFNGPEGDSSNYITWGGQFTAGGGLHFSKRFSLLAEYQFIGDKLPGKLIAETGANGGNAHIWSLTLDPVVDLFPKSTNSVYVTGGGGFYRKVTNFTDPEEAEYCDYYYCGVTVQNEVVGHFSSNQGGWNIGAGYSRRMGGIDEDSKMKLFAEVRFLDVNTPASAIAPNGLGVAAVGAGTKLVPVTFGLRW